MFSGFWILTFASCFWLHESQGLSSNDAQWLWTMDSSDEDGDVPRDIEDDSSLDASFSTSDKVYLDDVAISGKALHIESDGEVEPIEDIKRICLHWPREHCPSDVPAPGVSLIFWIRVVEWKTFFGTSAYQDIMFTTAADVQTSDRPGFYIGADPETDIYVYFNDNEKKYEVLFDRSLIYRDWAMLAVTWGAENGMRVAINASFVDDDRRENSVVETTVTFTDLIFGGSFTPNFLLDEVQIYYHEVSEAEMADLYRERIPDTAAPVPESTTRSATTTRIPEALTTTHMTGASANSTEMPVEKPTDPTIPSGGCTVDDAEAIESLREWREVMNEYADAMNEWGKEWEANRANDC